MVVGQSRWSQQLAFRRPRSNQEVQCEPARGRLVLSLRRDRLQPDRRRRRDVRAGRGTPRLIALDATTGKEIWIHEGLAGIITRGVNYWQSEDGKDRRLLFSINSFLQAIDAKTGKSILTFGMDGIVDLREGLTRAEGTDRRVQSEQPGQGLEEPADPRIGARRGFVTPPGDIRAYDVVTGKKRLAVPHRAAARRIRLRHVAERRLQVRRRREQLGLDVGRRGAGHRLYPDRLGDLRLLRRGSARHRTSSPIASSRSTRARASGCGISRRSITICGISTTSRRRSS